MDSETLRHFVLYELQTVALTIFGLLYAVKIWQLTRLAAPRELPPPRGSLPRAMVSSYGSIFMPWSLESTRRSRARWLAFAAYHVGILVAILATFTIPFLPALMIWPVRLACALLIGLAFLAGSFKLAWRRLRPELRTISTPDDYFSLLALQIWFLVAIPAILWEAHRWLIAYFVITALLLVYVPLSKISHYLYWFFSRYLFGLRYGRRGLF